MHSFIHPSIHSFAYLFIYLFIYLSIYLSIYLFIYLFIYRYWLQLTTRPIDESLPVVFSVLGIIVGIVYALTNQQGYLLVRFLLLPRCLSDTFLAYSFDYAPHRPHEITRCALPPSLPLSHISSLPPSFPCVCVSPCMYIYIYA